MLHGKRDFANVILEFFRLAILGIYQSQKKNVAVKKDQKVLKCERNLNYSCWRNPHGELERECRQPLGAKEWPHADNQKGIRDLSATTSRN